MCTSHHTITISSQKDEKNFLTIMSISELELSMDHGFERQGDNGLKKHSLLTFCEDKNSFWCPGNLLFSLSLYTHNRLIIDCTMWSTSFSWVFLLELVSKKLPVLQSLSWYIWVTKLIKMCSYFPVNNNYCVAICMCDFRISKTVYRLMNREVFGYTDLARWHPIKSFSLEDYF